VEATIAVNEARKSAMADRVVAACGGSLAGKVVAVLGLAFKPETDDMREAASLVMLPRLMAAGATIRAFDPAAMEQARPLLPAGIHYAANALEAITGADALVLLTEWNEFRALAPERLRDAMRGDVLVEQHIAMRGDVLLDLRNVYDPEAMRAAGFRYSSIGRP